MAENGAGRQTNGAAAGREADTWVGDVLPGGAADEREGSDTLHTLADAGPGGANDTIIDERAPDEVFADEQPGSPPRSGATVPEAERERRAAAPTDVADAAARRTRRVDDDEGRRTAPLDDATGDPDNAALARRIEERLQADAPFAQRDPILGRTIANRFVVENKIGSGGMGTVYKASQLGMERSVAIKVLRPELTENALIVKRFHMEALAVSKLSHPNTIRIYDFGQTEDRILFIAMEFLQGRPLDHVLRADGALPVALAVHVVSQVCRSLAEAHDKGIVHRDLKPENIFLCDIDGDQNFAKVLDFGVAKLRAEEQRQGTLTQAGMVFGTPKYMSPEQSRSEVVDHRSDVYALGVILYELLVGKAPFDAEDPLSVLIMQVQQPPPPLQVTRPDLVIPASVKAIVYRCLAKKTADRFQHVRELQEALDEAARGLPAAFDALVRREDAARLGLDLAQLEDMDETGLAAAPHERGTQVMSRGDAPAPGHRRRTLAIAAAAAVVLVSGALFAGYRSLPGLPPDLQEVFDTARLTLPALPAYAPATVTIEVRTTPPGATVYVADDPIGKAPLAFQRLRSATEADVTVRLDGFTSQSVAVAFSEDRALALALVPTPRVTVSAGTAEGGTVAAPDGANEGGTTGRRPPRKKPDASTGPTEFRGGKVRDVRRTFP